MSAHTPGRIPEMLRANLSTPELIELMIKFDRQKQQIQTLHDFLEQLEGMIEANDNHDALLLVTRAALEETKL